MHLTIFLIFVSISVVSVQQNYYDDKEEREEEELIINQTIAKYGPPQDYKKLNLPGIELESWQKTNTSKIDLKQDSNGYTLKVSTIEHYFIYTSRYERGVHFKKDPVTDRLKIAGQFTELIEMKWNNYLRAIGYLIDEKGYKQFLMELIKLPDEGDKIFGGIGSTLLITLSGGSQIG